jgi:4-alpha-glucanotransferase
MSQGLPKLIRFGREVCGDLAQAERREWWLANGRGAYAAGTVAGTLTRRYHGLLVAPVRPPLGRVLVVAKADATLRIEGREVPLFSNRWAGGTVDPTGHLHIESFELDGRMPVWRYRIGAVTVEMRLWMEPGADTTYVAYRLEGSATPMNLSVRLLVNARDHHGTTRAGDFDPKIECDARGLGVSVPDQFRLRVLARHGECVTERSWYENFDLAVERERGLPDRDSHLCVGRALLQLQPGEWSGLVLSLHDDPSPYLEEAMRRFREHDIAQLKRARAQLPEMFGAPDWIEQMVLAADSFVFSRPLPQVPDGESVIAGYPWFGDWGRDTMIALPGLTLATGRHDSARRILSTFARFVDQGMLPNVFPGAGDLPEYNTVDAALWYIEAWRAYVAATGDKESLLRSFAALENIIAWHQRGTRYGIRIDEADGLLRAGEPGVQLTWMDAKVGDWVVTPRIGKPVEINALWYNALLSMAELAETLGRSGTGYRALAAQTRGAFARFVNPQNGGLFDVIDGPDGADASVRPNQIFAVSLPHSPLDREAQARVVELCGRELFTSYGLRSLSPAHLDYRGIYAGGVWERDGSYHQGPVWTWLLGHYALAEYRVSGDAAAAQRRLVPLRDHLKDAALGSVSEIFDGNAPHMPRGAPAQAWSVACALEAWWRLERARRAGDVRREEGRAAAPSTPPPAPPSKGGELTAIAFQSPSP